MILLSVQGVSRQFDALPVFRNVSFEVRPGERIGLVGPNGAGKTTLLNILAGLDEPDEGRIERHPSAEVSLLVQQADFPPERTLLEQARSGLNRLYRLQTDSAELAESMAAAADEDQLRRLKRQYDRLQHDLERLDAYNIDHRVDEVLVGLGFESSEFDRPLCRFSGGQQSRALLAKLLLRSPHVMLLDEPTNHLDIAATEWLESYLSRSRRAMILVSHDRYFLDRVTNRILELNDASVTDYAGNFSAYWKQREERRKVLDRTYQKQQEFIAKTEDFIRRNKYGQKHAQAADREKKLSRIESVEVVRDFSAPTMTFGEPSRSGDWVIEAENVSKGFSEPLFEDVNLRIERGERIGILGPNGSGKTTLLRVLLGELPPDSGHVRFGTGLKIGYYDQQMALLDGDCDAVDAVRPEDRPDITPADIRSLLARFGVRGDTALQKINQLSGGEKSKVALARVSAQNANLLVLDEPTNHLDLWARAALEETLTSFEGTLLFVSHDRYFVDAVATSVILLDPPNWRLHPGTYSDCVAFMKSQAAETPQAGGEAARPEKRRRAESRASGDQEPRRKRQFPYRKVEDLEAEIADKESLIEQIESDLANPNVYRDGDRVRTLRNQYDETKAALDTLYEHWEEALELN